MYTFTILFFKQKENHFSSWVWWFWIHHPWLQQLQGWWSHWHHGQVWPWGRSLWHQRSDLLLWRGSLQWLQFRCCLSIHVRGSSCCCCQCSQTVNLQILDQLDIISRKQDPNKEMDIPKLIETTFCLIVSGTISKYLRIELQPSNSRSISKLSSFFLI